MRIHAVSSFAVQKNQKSATQNYKRNIAFGMNGEEGVQILERVAKLGKAQGVDHEGYVTFMQIGDALVRGLGELVTDYAGKAQRINGGQIEASIRDGSKGPFHPDLRENAAAKAYAHDVLAINAEYIAKGYGARLGDGGTNQTRAEFVADLQQVLGT